MSSPYLSTCELVDRVARRGWVEDEQKACRRLMGAAGREDRPAGCRSSVVIADAMSACEVANEENSYENINWLRGTPTGGSGRERLARRSQRD